MTTLISAEWDKFLRGKVLALILAGVTAQTLFFIWGVNIYNVNGASPVPGQTGVMVLADTSLFLQVWLLAFVGYFVASEFQNGTIRNILALGKNRTQVYLAKLLFACIALAAIFAAASIASTAMLSAASGFGDKSFIEFWRFYTWNFSMQLLYNLTYAAIFTMLAFLSRSVGMTLLLGFGFWIGKYYLPMILVRFGLAFAVQYLPDTFIGMFRQSSGAPAFITKGMIASVAYIAITGIIGCIVFKKSDIK